MLLCVLYGREQAFIGCLMEGLIAFFCLQFLQFCNWQKIAEQKRFKAEKGGNEKEK